MEAWRLGGWEAGRLGALGAGGRGAATREHAGCGYTVPNGALYSTVDDLARFVAFELGHGPDAVLPRARLDANFNRVNSSNGRLDSAYGVGFQAVRRGGRVYVGHGGSVAGYTAQAWVHRASQSGVIVLRSASGGRFDVTGLTFGALDVVAGVDGSPR
ncbi:MAG: serine hydrolase [Acidobacteriota bacterium]